jgi:hypothetical protein
MLTQPEKPILDQLARSMRTERQRQMISTMFTIMQTMANSTNPCEKRMASDLKLSLRYAKFVPIAGWLRDSKVLRWADVYSIEKKLGYSIDFTTFMTNGTMIPSFVSLNLNLNGMGMWMPFYSALSLRQDGFGKVFNQLMRSQSHNLQTPLRDLLSGEFKSVESKFNYRSDLNSMFDKLRISERINNNELNEPFGYLSLFSKMRDFAFIPFSKETIPEEIREMIMSSDSSISRLVQKAERMLKNVQIPFSSHAATFIHEQSRKIPTSIGMPLQISVKMPLVAQVSGVLKVHVDNMKQIKITLKEFKPSLVVSAQTKVECWSPVLNTGVKVLGQAKLFVPIDGSISINAKKSPMEILMNIRPTVVRHEELVTVQSRPIAFAIVWPKSLQQWQEPQEITIRGKEWTRVNSHFMELGEKSVGIKFISRGKWHRTPEKRVPTTPLPIMAGPNKYTLTWQPGHDMPKEISLRLTSKLFKSFDKKTVNVDFDRFYEDSSENFLSRESSEEMLDEDISMPEVEIENSEEYFKTYKGERPVNNEMKLIVSTKGSSTKRQATVMSTCLCDENMKSCKCKINIERTPIPTIESRPWKLESTIEALYPKTPFTMSELTEDKKLMGRITTKWGPVDNMEKEIDIKIVAEQSARMQRVKERSVYKRMHDNEQHRNTYKSLFSPVAQYTKTMKYGLLDEIKIDVDYKLSTVEKEYVNQIHRMIKNMYYSQSWVRNIDINNPEGRVRAKINIDPINRRYVNVTIMTPKEDCKLIDIPMPMDVSRLNMRRLSSPSRSFYDFVSSQVSSDEQNRCEVRTDRIRTFDDVEYDVPTSTCFTVIAKDCYQRQRSQFAVLIKKQSVNTEKKTLKIVTPNAKLIIKVKNNDKLECIVNGEKKPCHQIRVVEHNRHVVLRCQKYSRDSYLKCELPEAGIRVFFDGFAANLKVSSLYRGQICGLCGQSDENSLNDFSDELDMTVSRRELFDSYLLPEEENEQCEHTFPPRNTVLSFDDEEFEDLPEILNMPVRSSEFEMRPLEQTKVIEQSHELCFSKRPVKKCPPSTHPSEYESSKQKVVYCCLPRNDIQAEIFVNQVSEDLIVPEIESLPSSFTQKERVPKKCRPYDI